MFLLQSCMQSGQVLCGSFDETAICTGVSDTIVVKHKDGTFRSTPFLACFGPYNLTHQGQLVEIIINDHFVQGVAFELDKKGYLTPNLITDKQIRKLKLNFGVNKVTYKL